MSTPKPTPISTSGGNPDKPRPPKKPKDLDYDVLLDDGITNFKPDLKEKLSEVASKAAQDRKARTESATQELMSDPLARLAILKEQTA